MESTETSDRSEEGDEQATLASKELKMKQLKDFIDIFEAKLNRSAILEPRILK